MDFSDLVHFDTLPGTFRSKIMAVEERLKLLPEIDIPIEHHIGGGIYARTMVAPKGTLLTGRIYKKEQMIIMSSGDHSFRSESMGGRIRGPYIFTAPAGSKRVGYCHTETVWTCLVRTDALTVEDAEKDVYASSYDELDAYLVDNATIEIGG